MACWFSYLSACRTFSAHVGRSWLGCKNRCQMPGRYCWSMGCLLSGLCGLLSLQRAYAAFWCWLAILVLCSAVALSVWISRLGMVTFLVILVNACLTWSVLCRRICTCFVSRLVRNLGSASAGFPGFWVWVVLVWSVGSWGTYSLPSSRRREAVFWSQPVGWTHRMMPGVGRSATKRLLSLTT